MMVARNPARVDLYERYQEIVQEYNKDKDAAEIQKVMDDLLTFNDNLNEEEKRYLREGLENEDQLAVAKELLDKLSSGKLQIDHWREKATAQAQVKAEIIKHLFAHLPSGAYDADEINLKANSVFAHIYTAGFSEGARGINENYRFPQTLRQDWCRLTQWPALQKSGLIPPILEVQ